MTAKRKPQVLAIGSHRALKLAQEALSEDVHIVRALPAHELRTDGADLALADVRFERTRVMRLLRSLNESADARGLPVISCAAPQPAAFVDVGRLTRHYGHRVAAEVLRQVVATRLSALPR